MKSLFALLLVFVYHNGKAQSVSTPYRPQDRSVNYSYDSIRQTINYSGNWDFDGDGMKDSLFFIGNHGAHLYFHPRLVLSTDKKIIEFDWIQTDLPLLGDVNELKEDDNDIFPKFVVHDFDKDGLADIYFNFDRKFSPIPVGWRKRGVTSHRLLLKCPNKRCKISNYQ